MQHYSDAIVLQIVLQMALTGAFLGTEYTSLVTLVSEGGGGNGSSGWEYVCIRHMHNASSVQMQ